MSAPFMGNRPGSAPGLPNLPEPPSGWPVGSYEKYEEAQRAVDHLADNDFPVADVTIVGVDLMLVERVIGRLTWGRVLVTGAASGAWLGLFVGVVLSLFSPNGSIAAIAARPRHGHRVRRRQRGAHLRRAGGRRDFTSASQMVAGRYDVLCQPRNAEKARDMLAKLAIGTEQT